MHLIWATDDFKLNGVSYVGFPILLEEDLTSAAYANEFLRWYLTRGVIASKQSWPSTGRALYDYFSFLEAHELNWREPRVGDQPSSISAYRDYSKDVINLASDTIRQRVLYVCEFYEYALAQSWINALPFDYEERRGSGSSRYLAHLNASGNVTKTRDVMPKARRHLPQFLSTSQAKALITAARNIHHRMVIRTALHTGMRREELATFPMAYVFDPIAAGRSERNIRIRLDPNDGNGMRTKGNKARDVYLSAVFLQELAVYCNQHRGERARLSDDPQSPVFLNDRGQPYAASGKQIQRIVATTARLAGFRAWPHMLRHTYATHTLHRLQDKRSLIDPLVFLMNQLGHESIETTMTYLHLVRGRADDAVLAYDDELNTWMDEG